MPAEETLLGTIDYRDGEKIHVRTLTTNGVAKLDIRVHVDKDTYTGWSKSGVRLGKDQVKELKTLIAKFK